MSGEDYIKYLTKEFVAYVDLPAEEKKKRKISKTKTQPFYSNRWFGLLPYAFKSFLQRVKK